MRNNLKRPTTNKKRPETTYNEQETTWNDLQQPEKTYKEQETTWKQLATSKKQPTTSKTQPTMTQAYLQQQKKKDAKWPTASRFWDYFTIWGNWFSSLARFQHSIWLQSFKHCSKENHGENRALNISILSCAFILGYKIYRILTLQTTLTLTN